MSPVELDKVIAAPERLATMLTHCTRSQYFTYFSEIPARAPSHDLGGMPSRPQAVKDNYMSTAHTCAMRATVDLDHPESGACGLPSASICELTA
jgi:hypothetical protein